MTLQIWSATTFVVVLSWVGAADEHLGRVRIARERELPDPEVQGGGGHMEERLAVRVAARHLGASRGCLFAGAPLSVMSMQSSAAFVRHDPRM